MRLLIFILLTMLGLIRQAKAQVEPGAGKWKTWFISAKDYRLPAPPSGKTEIAQVLSAQQNLDSAGWQQLQYWNAGAPGYRWQEMIEKLWMYDTTNNGALANMLMGAATYDATIAAWDTKYAYNRPRPYTTDKRIKALVYNAGSPSYPNEHAVAAGVAVAIISHFYPALADSVMHMAHRVAAASIASGAAYPSDVKAGFELGKKIAEKEIERTRGFVPASPWDGKRLEGAAYWKGQPMFPQAGSSKTVVLDSVSQFRPGPPPDYAKDMAELKKFKPTFRSTANAFFWASQSFWQDQLHKKIFEYNLNLNPPGAARLYALKAISEYDCFASCWDAKYAYWGIRPDQYDTTFHPVLFNTPPFPGYPSGHAMMSGMLAELYSYFFPAERAYFEKKAKDAAESRFQGGIHFRTDNEVGLQVGKKVAQAVVSKAKQDGSKETGAMAQKK